MNLQKFDGKVLAAGKYRFGNLSFGKSFFLPFFLVLFFSHLFLNSHAQNDKYREWLREIRYLSYFDSASLFQRGNEVIESGKKEKHPELECEVLVFYGNHFYYKTKVKEAKKYYQKAQRVAESINSRRYVNYSRIRLAYLMWDKGEIEESEKIFKAILKESEKKGHYVNIIESCNAMALSKSYQNKYKECMTYFLKGLRVAEDQNEEQYQAVLLNNIGLLKVNDKQYDAALADFKKAVEISERMNDARLTFHLYNNMALIFMDKGKMDEARQQYEKIMSYAHKSNNPKEMGIAATNLSNIYNGQGNLEMATAYCDTAILSFKENHYTLELTKGYLTKSMLLLKSKRYAEAEKFVNMARYLADSTGNLEDAVEIHLALSRIFEAKGNTKLALDEYKEFRKLGDSLKELMNTKAIAELQSKYNVERKDAAIEKEKNKNLELENKNLVLEQKSIEEREESERRMIWGISSGVAIILIISIYFYASYNRKTRQQQQFFAQQLIHDIEEERNRIAKDLHDDVGQSLSAIKSKLNLIYQNDLEKAHVLGVEDEVGKVIEQTRDISRRLYPAYLEKIGLTRSVARLMEGVQESTDIVCSFEIDPETDKLPINMLTHIYRILQECVNNTIKHAEATALKVTIHKKEDTFQMIYQDNGKGIQKPEVKSTGIGLMSLKERARILKGELNIGDNSGRGFRLIINFNQTLA